MAVVDGDAALRMSDVALTVGLFGLDLRGRGDVLALQDGGEAGGGFGLGGGEVLALSGIGGEVVEFEGGVHIGTDGFPVAGAGGLHLEAVLPDFPIEVVVNGCAPGGGVGFEELAGDGAAVDGAGGGGSGEFGEGGEDVLKAPGGGTGGAGGDATGPAGDHGNADAAFVEVTLVATEGAGGLKEIGVVAVVAIGAIVGGEDDEGVVAEVEFIEGAKEFADGSVEAGDHAGEGGFGRGMGGVVHARGAGERGFGEGALVLGE